MKKPINLYLATSTSCNVRCKTCPVGRMEKEQGGMMSVDMMVKILDKAINEARVISVQLYHYNEPMLIPHIAEMVRQVHLRKIPVFLSSNLVDFRNVPAVMAQEPETLLISVSGWTQSVYERSHRNGNIEKVKAHMQSLVPLRKPKTNIQVSWHRYRYNQHEEVLMREFAQSLGFNFNAYGTGLLPQSRAMKEWETGIVDPDGEDCLVPVADAKELCAERKHWPCTLQNQILMVNGDGNYTNCSNYSDDANIRGNFFNTTVAEIFQRRKTDPMCIACKAVGAHVYALQEYTRSKYSLIKLAENTYRRLGLQGRFPKFSLWATNHLYVRPQSKKTI